MVSRIRCINRSAIRRCCGAIRYYHNCLRDSVNYKKQLSKLLLPWLLTQYTEEFLKLYTKCTGTHSKYETLELPTTRTNEKKPKTNTTKGCLGE